MINETISNIVRNQQKFFINNQNTSYKERVATLKKLHQVIKKNQKNIVVALKLDLNRNEIEAMIELSVLKEIKFAIKQLSGWIKPRKVATSKAQSQSKCYVVPRALGPTLIIAPWNYPFELTLKPLIGAIAAGNPVIIKPSEYAPNCANLLVKMINQTFDIAQICVVNGDIAVTQELLRYKFAHVFFTGSSEVGKMIYSHVAKSLTKVTLELGGKSPVILDAEVNLKVSLRRILWGKLINAGQTCIAPDYLLIDRKIYPKALKIMVEILEHWFDSFDYASYAKIVNQKHYDRILGLLEGEEILFGGDSNHSTLQIYPTLVKINDTSSPLMTQEIFGPVLPIVIYDSIYEAISLINSKPNPLALYVFSKNQKIINYVLNNTLSGGVTINDTLLHQATYNAPFGGVNASGLGSYHGKYSFATFSHYQTVLRKSFHFDFTLRYRPYSWFKNLVMRWIV